MFILTISMSSDMFIKLEYARSLLFITFWEALVRNITALVCGRLVRLFTAEVQA